MSQIDDGYSEFLEVADRLRRESPELTDLELDQIKVRAMRQAARDTPGFVSRQKEKFMKSRLALTTMLVLGLLLAFSGIAVAQIDGDDGAGAAQYGGIDSDSTPVGVGDEGISGDGDVVEADEQLAFTDGEVTGDGTLPLTGFVAIPLIAIGAILAVTGALLRRRVRRDEE